MACVRDCSCLSVRRLGFFCNFSSRFQKPAFARNSPSPCQAPCGTSPSKTPSSVGHEPRFGGTSKECAGAAGVQVLLSDASPGVGGGVSSQPVPQRSLAMRPDARMPSREVSRGHLGCPVKIGFLKIPPAALPQATTALGAGGAARCKSHLSQGCEILPFIL